MPLPTAQKRIFGAPDDIHFITIGLDDIKDMDTAKAEVKRALWARRRITSDDEENYMLMSQQDALENFGQFLIIITSVLGGIAAVSLLVGGVGRHEYHVLVSVTERTHEIGLRKAVGARKVDILLQFLIEAIVLCVIGGAVGMASAISAPWDYPPPSPPEPLKPGVGPAYHSHVNHHRNRLLIPYRNHLRSLSSVGGGQQGPHRRLEIRIAFCKKPASLQEINKS